MFKKFGTFSKSLQSFVSFMCRFSYFDCHFRAFLLNIRFGNDIYFMKVNCVVIFNTSVIVCMPCNSANKRRL